MTIAEEEEEDEERGEEGGEVHLAAADNVPLVLQPALVEAAAGLPAGLLRAASKSRVLLPRREASRGSMSAVAVMCVCVLQGGSACVYA